MRQVKKTSVSYVCGKCGSEFPKRRQAEKCEAGSCEPRRFNVGDEVRALQPRYCSSRGNRRYKVAGKIVGIVGLSLYDSEVMLKGFGIEPTYAHCYWYEVEYVCPACRKTKRVRYPTEALRFVRPIVLSR